jgi:16S rRNA (cytidine1402-2'-O)-methyltransferase
MKSYQTVSLSPGLYIIATPIGNLRDISLRALDVLASVDCLFCEDSRVTGKLLKAFDINARLQVYNDHSSAGQRAKILKMISNGQAVGLVSDAGMPLISDPGYKLVRDCMDLGAFVTTIPGASAPLAALQLSGLPSDKFVFGGFLPVKSEARKAFLQNWSDTHSTLIFFETGPRLLKSLNDIKDVLGDRQIAVIREITKMHEQVIRDTAGLLIERYMEQTPKGEIVLVIEGADNRLYDDHELDALIKMELGQGKTSLKELAKKLSDQTGVSKKILYERALLLKKQAK